MKDNNRTVLLWGARAKSRIADAMLAELNLGQTKVIFDSMLAAPEFKHNASFVNKIEQLHNFMTDVTHYIVCIGGEHGYARVQTAHFLERHGLKPISLVHDAAFIDKTSTHGLGLHAMPGSVLHKFSVVGEHCILNTNSSVDHDCEIGDGVHIMGGATLAGKVTVGDYATIGTNATVLPNVKIGDGAYVGAGAVVTKDVPAHTVVTGVPARRLRDNAFVFDGTLFDKY